MPIDILTPVGRLVQGSPLEPRTTDSEGNPLLIKKGPNAGQSRVEYFLAIAIPKSDPGYSAIEAKIKEAARLDYPTMIDANGNANVDGFAFKITDGDSVKPDKKGRRPCDREGFPGHWVLRFSSGFAPKCYTANGDAVITDPDAIKRGYYLRVYGTVRGNGSNSEPGVFLNPSMVELVGYGEEIVSGPDGASVFGNTPAANLPPGASATPVAPATTLAPPRPPVAPPHPPVAPAPEFLTPPAPAPLEPKYLDANGTAWTLAQLVQAGYTQEQAEALPRA